MDFDYFHQFRSSPTDCNTCPLKENCLGKSKEKKIDVTVDRPYYERMHQRLKTTKAKRMKKLRSSTVEPVLGTLVNFMGMHRIWGPVASSRPISSCSGSYCLQPEKHLKFSAEHSLHL
ncbi:transposase [Solitalea lacus]|uniref:transposase n=1 Tax=Solitalea lacus TaxID=2911172 RepID=UPI003B848D21